MLAAGGLLAGLGAIPAQADTVHVTAGWEVVAAPTKDSKGGVVGPVVLCGAEYRRADSYVVTAQQGTRVVARDTTNGWVRVKRGTYLIKVIAKCAGTVKTLTKTATVGYLTDAHSVSHGEYKALKKGQSLATVRRITGSRLHNDGTYSGVHWYHERSTSFLNYVTLRFKHGKLTQKSWGPRPF